MNPDSLIVRDRAKLWNLQKDTKLADRFQFERIGYFYCDEASDFKKKKFVFNRTVELRESKAKK